MLKYDPPIPPVPDDFPYPIPPPDAPVNGPDMTQRVAAAQAHEDRIATLEARVDALERAAYKK